MGLDKRFKAETQGLGGYGILSLIESHWENHLPNSSCFCMSSVILLEYSP